MEIIQSSFLLTWFDFIVSRSSLMCIFSYRAKQQEMVLADMFIEPGKIWEYCPREALRRVSKILKDEFDLVCLISFCATSEKSYISNFISTCSGRECRL